MSPVLSGKRLQLLKEVIPNVRRVAVLANPSGSPAYPLVMETVKKAARSLDQITTFLQASARGAAIIYFTRSVSLTW